MHGVLRLNFIRVSDVFIAQRCCLFDEQVQHLLYILHTACSQFVLFFCDHSCVLFVMHHVELCDTDYGPDSNVVAQGFQEGSSGS